MATAYRHPENIKPPSFGDMDTYWTRCDAYRQEVAEWARANTKSKSDLVGEIIHLPFADGYASYVVFNTQPLQLLLLLDGDAWSADPMTIRGMRLTDVKNMVALNKRRREAVATRA